MKIKINNILLIAIVTILTTIAMSTISNAASLSISTSKSSVEPGETFTVTVTLDGAAGPVSASSSNATGSFSGKWLENSSESFSCTAGSEGTITISASGTVGDFSTGNDVSVNASKSVAVVAKKIEAEEANTNTNQSTTTNPTSNTNTSSSSTQKSTTTTTKTNTKTVTKSSNSKLSNLSIAECIISPEFSSSIKEYSVSVPNDVTKLSISATADNSKATINIYGNEELQVGDNKIEIVVTAEDGSKTTYIVTATRMEQELNLKELKIYYLNENQEKIYLLLNPQFDSNIYEYSISEILDNQIEDLRIETSATRNEANIEIFGNHELKVGENEIIINVSIVNESGLEEQKVYTIFVEKDEEEVIIPLTTTGKIKNWFNTAGNNITGWISSNFDNIFTGMLVVATTALAGLTIYFAYDYKKYQELISKLSTYNKQNLNKRANVALNPDTVSDIEDKPKTGGKRFKE